MEVPRSSAGFQKTLSVGSFWSEKAKADYACRCFWSNPSDAGSIPAISTIEKRLKEPLLVFVAEADTLTCPATAPIMRAGCRTWQPIC